MTFRKMTEKIVLPHHQIVFQWKEEKVIKWLKKVHLEDCIPAFEVRHIDGPKFLDLNEQKLFTFQDLKIKHRKQIAKCVQECKSQASNAKRIAKNLKPKHGSQSQSSGSNGACDSWDDSDGWGSDFDDESDEEVNKDYFIPEVNNNTITDSVPGVLEKVSISGPMPVAQLSEEKSIPKPPDVPIISKAINGTTNLKNNFSSTIPRPPLKRPPSQPPPPPVPQAASHDDQEDYEIPIVPSSVNSRENFALPEPSYPNNLTSDTYHVETYEIVEPPEENYEIVDLPSQHMADKPILPPRLLKSPIGASPPPLPQKPQKLKETSPTFDGVRTFSRPKLPAKPEVEAPTEITPVGFIGSLKMGRRGSAPTSSPSPKLPQKNKDIHNTSILNSASLNLLNESLSTLSSSPERDLALSLEQKKQIPLPPLPPRGLPIAEDSAPNMATRPLPPVPLPKVEEKPSYAKQTTDVYQCPWFHEMEREAAETAVKKIGEPGAFVVRPSIRAGKDNPYSLTVWHEDRLFHLNIRQRSDNTFALGKEKEKEKTFASVPELITFHLSEPILLKNRGESAGRTILRKYPEKT